MWNVFPTTKHSHNQIKTTKNTTFKSTKTDQNNQKYHI